MSSAVAGRGPGGDHVDDAANGARPVEIAGSAAHHFDIANGELRLLVPVDPSAQRIVERLIVFRDQSAAGGGGTEAAQADALRGGVGDQRTRSAVELHARKLAHLAVEGDGRGGAERGLREQARGGRALQLAERRAIGGDRNFLGACGRAAAGPWPRR